MHASSSVKQTLLFELLLLSLSPSLLLSPVFSQGPCVEGVTMYSLLVAVVLLATAANNNRGQSTKGTWVGGNVIVGMYRIRFP